MLDTQCKQIDAIDAILAYLIIKEDLLESLWFLSKGGCSYKEPAIAQLTLSDICWLNSIGAPKLVRGELILHTQPGNPVLKVSHHLGALRGVVSPVKSVIHWERNVCELCVLSVEFFQFFFASIVSC